MDAHHKCPNGSTRLEKQYPSTIEKQEDSKHELNRISRSLDVVNIVVQSFPHWRSESIDHEKGVNQQRYDNL